MWWPQLICFLIFVYIITHPEWMLYFFFHGMKLALTVHNYISACCSRVKLLKKKAKRNLLLQTKTFDERPVMQRPSLQPLRKKLF